MEQQALGVSCSQSKCVPTAAAGTAGVMAASVSATVAGLGMTARAECRGSNRTPSMKVRVSRCFAVLFALSQHCVLAVSHTC
jgi:hypothetical protein